MTEADGDRIVRVVELDAPVSRVWTALTDHREFGTWFRVTLDQPFEVGGESTGRMTYPGHEGVRWVAFVERMDPERLFSFRWYDSEDGSVTSTKDQPSLLTEFRLANTSHGTRLTTTESGYSALPEPRQTELLRNCREGWDMQADNLAEYLST